jgi:uncharacterized protein YegL
MGIEAEFVKNPQPRCAVVLLLDNSGSMAGEPIKQLNEGIAEFKRQLDQDSLATQRVEVAIVSFGPVTTVQDFVTVDQFVPPRLEAAELTPMGEAINVALDMVADRKQTYKDSDIQYYRPWVFLITDGAPTDSWQSAAQRVQQEEDNKKILFFAVGVKDADMNILKQITPSIRPPLLLNGLDFAGLFKWLSNSLGSVSHSSPGDQGIQLAPPTWGFQISV